MKYKILPLIFIILISTLACSTPLDIARYTISQYIDDANISQKYFNDIKRVQENDEYFIFSMSSIEPRENALCIFAYIPKTTGKKIKVSHEGDLKYFMALRGSNKFNFNQLLLLQIFGYGYFKYPDKKGTNYFKYKDVKFNEIQKETLIEFSQLKHGLIQFFFDNDKVYPKSLNELLMAKSELNKSIIKDEFNNEYYYMIYGKYIVLGSMGKN